MTTQNSEIRLISSTLPWSQGWYDNLVINLLLENLIGQFKLVIVQVCAIKQYCSTCVHVYMHEWQQEYRQCMWTHLTCIILRLNPPSACDLLRNSEWFESGLELWCKLWALDWWYSLCSYLSCTPYRFGEPDDCGGAVSFLCSDDALYISGETIVIAGGTHSRL